MLPSHWSKQWVSLLTSRQCDKRFEEFLFLLFKRRFTVGLLSRQLDAIRFVHSNHGTACGVDLLIETKAFLDFFCHFIHFSMPINAYLLLSMTWQLNSNKVANASFCDRIGPIGAILAATCSVYRDECNVSKCLPANGVHVMNQIQTGRKRLHHIRST